MVSERVFEDLLIFEVSVLDLMIFCTYIEDYWCFGDMESRFLFKLLIMEIYTVHLIFLVVSLIQKSIDVNHLFWSNLIYSNLILIWPIFLADSLFMVHKLIVDPLFIPWLYASFASDIVFCSNSTSMILVIEVNGFRHVYINSHESIFFKF